MWAAPSATWVAGETALLTDANTSCPGSYIVTVSLPGGFTEKFSGSGVGQNYTIDVFKFTGTGDCTNRCMTNYTARLSNAYGMPARGVWSLNGIVQKEARVNTGGSASYTYPVICKDDVVSYKLITEPFSGTNQYDGFQFLQLTSPVSGSMLASNVDWTGIGTNNLPSQDDTLKAVGGAIVAGTKILDSDLRSQLGLLSGLSNGSGNVTVSNSIVITNSLSLTNISTNDFSGLTNYLKTTSIDTNNWPSIAEIAKGFLTGLVMSAVASAQTVLTNTVGTIGGVATGGVSAVSAPSSGDEFSATLQVGTSPYLFVISSADIPGVGTFTTARSLIVWVIWVSTAVYLGRRFRREVSEFLSQRQIAGNTQQIFGCNATVVFAGAFAVVIAGLIVFISVQVGSAMSNIWATAASAGNAFGQVTTFAWNSANYLFPCDTFIQAFFLTVSVELGLFSAVFWLARVTILALLSD